MPLNVSLLLIVRSWTHLGCHHCEDGCDLTIFGMWNGIGMWSGIVDFENLLLLAMDAIAANGKQGCAVKMDVT